jgi:MFS family permease
VSVRATATRNNPYNEISRIGMKRQPAVRRVKRFKEVLRDEISGLGSPNVYHATIVIFLEFFAWGLLTGPVITVIGESFPNHTLLMNGLIQGVKGFLSFLSAPLIGALSDVWGRKSFLLLSVFFTCLPIPLLYISPWWYFVVFSVSGVFAVTFSVVFAYVADITDENDRSSAYGQVISVQLSIVLS